MKRVLRKYLLFGLAALAVVGFSGVASAQDEKPFADQKFVLQISDMDPDKQTLVLNVASNIIKYYGPDKADVEIVAFGPGLRLLFAENSNSGRIDGLTQSGVRFAACNNTINNMTKTLGSAPKLHASATVVPGGIVRIKELADQGYLLVKP
jgi:hypothetical protein